MINSIKIIYTDIAVGAKQEFLYSMADKEDFSDLTDLNNDYDVQPLAIIGDKNRTFLDESQLIAPNDKTGLHLGIVSSSISNDDKTFTSPIQLIGESSNNYTSQGITITFDTLTDTYPVSVNIKWYRGSTLLEDEDFNVNSNEYFFEKLVENFNKIVITFNDLNMPFNHLIINNIEFGVVRTFKNDEISGSLNVLQEISPVSNELSIDTMDFNLVSNSDVPYLFQSKQPMQLKINDELIGTFFVKTGKKMTDKKYSIECEDYIGLMDLVNFKGGIYTNKDVEDLIDEIMTSCNVPYEIVDTPSINTVTGYLAYQTAREALQQVLFAIGMVADTSNSDIVKIYNVSNESSNSYGDDRIIVGQSIEQNEVVTEVQLDMTIYKQNNESTTLYDVAESGTCENRLIVFDSPKHSLTISGGTLIDSGTNYAVVTFSSSTGTLTGKGYDVTTSTYSVKNPVINVGDIENIKMASGATLISPSNVEFICNKLYDYYTKRKSTECSIVELENKLGDCITVENESLGNVTGVLSKIERNYASGELSEIKVE